MSKDIVVLAPNGRRQTVKCNVNTTILQILEEVCKKQGLDPDCYDLKHHNKVLDLTNTIRYSNLPNKANLEMAETDRRREEKDVTIALQLENDERRTGVFKPKTSLLEVVQNLASEELPLVKNPTVVYMRTEVHGSAELESTSLKQLGLTGGRAVLRLIDKSKEELRTQANVSKTLRPKSYVPEDNFDEYPSTSSKTVAPWPTREEKESNASEPTTSNIDQSEASKQNETKEPDSSTNSIPGPSVVTPFMHNIPNPIKLIRDEIRRRANVNAVDEQEEEENKQNEVGMEVDEQVVKPTESLTPESSSSSVESKRDVIDEELLQRRLNIEQEVTFLGENKAIAFEQSSSEPELAELPDDFYELSVDEVRRLYHELRQSVASMTNAPLMTSEQRSAVNNNERRAVHKHAVVRIQFPDRTILQGVFEPTDDIERVYAFTRSYLQRPERPFHLFTTPTRETLDPSVSLQDAGFVPGVLAHFRWADELPATTDRCLREAVYENLTSSDAAAMLASKYRTPIRPKREVALQQRTPNESGPSSTRNGKLPKWFKL